MNGKKINFLMFLLLVTLLSVCFSQTQSDEKDQVLELALEEWHKTLYELDTTYFCEEVDIKQYTGEKWTNLSSDTQDEIVHCLWKKHWLHDDVKSNKLYKASKTTPCDVMVVEGKWSEMSILDKRFVHDCIMKRITMEYLRNSVPLLHWLPDSYLYDDSVRRSVEDDVFHCALIYRQFQEDQAGDFDHFLKKRLGGWPILNNSHYDRESVGDDESLKQFQENTTVNDYVEWNSPLVKNCEPYTSFKEVGRGILDSVETDYFTIIRKLVALRDRNTKFGIDNVLLNSYVYFSEDIEWKHPE